MKTILKSFAFLIIAFLITISGYGQTVVYDGGTPNRPIAVNGLEVNGITYNITITYGVLIDGTITSGFDIADATVIADALAQILNTQGTESMYAFIEIVTGDVGVEYQSVQVRDIVVGDDDWDVVVVVSQPDATRNDTGFLTFTRVISSPPIPTMSQWGLLIFGLLIMNISVFFVQRRELI